MNESPTETTDTLEAATELYHNDPRRLADRFLARPDPETLVKPVEPILGKATDNTVAGGG